MKLSTMHFRSLLVESLLCYATSAAATHPFLMRSRMANATSALSHLTASVGTSINKTSSLRLNATSSLRTNVTSSIDYSECILNVGNVQVLYFPESTASANITRPPEIVTAVEGNYTLFVIRPLLSSLKTALMTLQAPRLLSTLSGAPSPLSLRTGSVVPLQLWQHTTTSRKPTRRTYS